VNTLVVKRGIVSLGALSRWEEAAIRGRDGNGEKGLSAGLSFRTPLLIFAGAA
jgi:hypothetical protein